MKKIISSYPVYLFLLPVFFILHHNNQLFAFIPFSQSVTAFLIFVLSILVCFGIYFMISRSVSLSSMVAFLLAVFIFYFGAYLKALKTVFDHAWITKYVVLVPLTFLIIFLLTRYFKRKPTALKKVQTYLNFLFVIFVALELVDLSINTIEWMQHRNLIYHEKPISSGFTPSDSDPHSSPDIYFIIFDGYTNNNALKKIWGFDDSYMMNWLKDQGFYIVDSGNANYNFTAFSVSSTLNMNYLNQDLATKAYKSPIALRAINSISNNETIDILKKKGYLIRIFTPFYNSFDDIGLHKDFNDAAFLQLYNQTFPKRFEKDVLWNFVSGNLNPGWVKKPKIEELAAYKEFSQRANDIPKTIEALKGTCDSLSTRKPKFVYGHLMITHQPHLFDSLGNLRKGIHLISQLDLAATYTQQVQHANVVMKDLVKYIQDHNKKNTIIIIEGDHGFRALPPSMTKYQFANLNAIYFPGGNYKDFYAQMSPVNTFRIVFNHYFDQKLSLLKDTSIWVTF